MSVISQLLNQDTSCIDIIELMFGLSPLESLMYFHLLQDGEKTVAQLCEDSFRKQTTVHLALQNLVSRGICNKKKRNKIPRGYEYLYSAFKPSVVQKILKERLERLYACTSKCIAEFGTKALFCEINFN